jgi:hypothetical protein
MTMATAMSHVTQITQPVSVWQSQGVSMVVSTVGAFVLCGLAVYYFRRVRLERPPIGTFNGRDIAILMVFITAIPFLYAAVPLYWLVGFLALAFCSSLSIGFRPVFGERRLWLLWLLIGLLVGGNIWTSHNLLGSTAGWQLWWGELSVLVILSVISVSNLYVQGGMRLRFVAWLALAVAVYDATFVKVIPLTNKLAQELLGKPLDPSLGMRFGIDNFSIGIGDMLIFALFTVAAYKAYGKHAARLSFALVGIFGIILPALTPFMINLVDARGDTVVPNQTIFGPAAFLCYLWLKRKYGRERTMAEYLASADSLSPRPVTAPQPAPAPEPASV